MWKKLALLVAVASAVTQAVRYWNDAGTKTAAKRTRDARHDVQRWEDEGGNLPPVAAKDRPAGSRPSARRRTSSDRSDSDSGRRSASASS